MFSRDFLLQIADTYGLTSDQKEIFFRRFLENKSHQEIADELGINVPACLRRMAEVYKKFSVEGQSRGKDGALRKFLIEQSQLQLSNVSALPSDSDLTERIDSISDRLSTLEKHVPQEPGIVSTDSQRFDRLINPINTSFHHSSRHNLPTLSNNFIGREDELKRLLRYLSEDHAHPMITVDGIGGVGKTALVLEAAYRCLERRENRKSSKQQQLPRFDAIIFTSAKETYLFPLGIVKRPDMQRTLNDICKEIAITLDKPYVNQDTGVEQFECVKRALREGKTLLIVDNLETVDKEEKDKVLGFLRDLPNTVRTVITTREQLTIYVDIRLDSLTEKDSIELIKQQIRDKNLTLNAQDIQDLYKASGGIPLVIIYGVGRLANSIGLDTLKEDLKSSTGDLAQFLFRKSVEELKDQPAYKLLMALAVFREAPRLDALVAVAGLKQEPIAVVRNALERLMQLSLVRQENQQYRTLPPTREYALSELNNNPDFQKEARDRWFKWYLEFAQENGGDDEGEWHIKYDKIEGEWRNFLEILDWSANQSQYNEVKQLWEYLNKFASLYGYWNDRLNLLDWLVEASQKRGDWETFVSVVTAKIWTLILKESDQNLAEADRLQEEAWNRREKANLASQSVLAENIAVLRIRQGKYEDARQWFAKYKQLEKKAKLDNRQQRRSEIRYLYYEAEILYREGKYGEAKEYYKQVLKQADEIGWLRFVVNAQSWLATIAIKQEDLKEAEKLLTICLPVAERNKDTRRTACCQYSFARLEKAKGNLEQARQWAQEALENFKKLEIKRDIGEVNSFLEAILN